ncbi:B3 domain-containing protein At3g25182-like [Gossypium raimondii]|uniref:B3 domain-containing protein At3g25182-like n=1 Tax=Gossypium raimondii TaxID=29730 RepID=UPI00227CB981|nr:B3 domain-containing protein At3g25182-like [Gossypium raimondii]
MMELLSRELKSHTAPPPPQTLCKQDHTGFKLRFKFNNSVGLKRKRNLKAVEEEDDGDWVAPKLKPKRRRKQDNPQLIVEEMGSRGLVLVIQKTIFFSDINPTASRFSIPFSQVKTHDFLNEAEAKELDDKNPMQVWLLDPSMKGTNITFNKWVMGSSSLYVLTNTWNPVVKNNQLKKGEMVQLWSFRLNSLLYFALVKL